MLKSCGLSSLEELTDVTVPAHIRLNGKMTLEDPMSETEALAHHRLVIQKHFESPLRYFGLVRRIRSVPTRI